MWIIFRNRFVSLLQSILRPFRAADLKKEGLLYVYMYCL